MPTYEGLRLKVLKFKRRLFSKKYQRKLVSKEFTIISNNCWGGMIYESYNLQKKSPTVGLFFMAHDYICFLSKLKEYIYNSTLDFIPPYESKWQKEMKSYGDDRFGSYPIGKLTLADGESIELFFLHYHSEQEAREKWQRRCQRICWEKLLVKFNDQNGCTEEDIENFIHLNFKNKCFFTVKRWDCEDKWKNLLGGNYCRIKQFPSSDSIRASYEPFWKSRYIDISKLINQL